MKVEADPYIRYCKPAVVIDGDTVVFEISVGFYATIRQSIRLMGVDAPELYKGSEGDRQRGQSAKRYVAEWLQAHNHEKTNLWPYLLQSKKADKFGRFLGHVVCSQGHSLSEDIVASGNASAYFVKPSLSEGG